MPPMRADATYTPRLDTPLSSIKKEMYIYLLEGYMSLWVQRNVLKHKHFYVEGGNYDKYLYFDINISAEESLKLLKSGQCT